LIDMKYKHLIS